MTRYMRMARVGSRDNNSRHVTLARVSPGHGCIAMKNRHVSFLLLSILLLTACAVTPKFDTSAMDLSITPTQAINEAESLRGTAVLWGGVIIASSNLKQQLTQFEILAYPLANNQQPDVEQKPLGRFIAQHQGYLETADYAQGRLITIAGSLQGTRQGRVGDSEYTYPLLTVNSLQLWSRAGTVQGPQLHFGIGIMFHD